MVTSLVLAAACGLLMLKVEVNSDMTKYLPDNFNMKIGMDIMNESFPAMDQGQTVRVMATGLDERGKAQLLNELQSIKNVSSVSHDSSEDYNKGDKSLFILHTDFAYGSMEELAIERSLQYEFLNYDLVFKNDEINQSQIPPWVLAIAIILVLIILFAMCGSWFEPVLFLATIGVAVLINGGTNIVMGSISNVTQSISAILQMILSMDYSIILMNRYRQEKANCTNKFDAMKLALKNAFSSVASSSFTTVVGLLMLVFMQFKIGVDLGVVLAKGVFISMLCVFTLLPVLILLFDKIIEKSAKKELTLPMGALARFSYKFRYILGGAFIVAFAAFYILQGNTQTAYSLETKDPIADVFPTTNMLVLVYDNEDEQLVADMTEELEKEPHVQQAMGYPNLLAKKRTSLDMLQSIDSLSNSFGISMDVGIPLDESLLKVVYYDCFDGTALPAKMGDFLGFLSEDIMNNKAFEAQINPEMRESAKMLKVFSSRESLNKKRSIQELSSLFGIDEELVESLMVYYFSTRNYVDAGKMTTVQFADFVVNEVAENEMYSSFFDEETKAQLSMLTTFTDKDEITKLRGYEEMAELLGAEPSQMRLLYFALVTEDQDGYTENFDAARQLNLQQVINYLVNNSSAFSTMMSEEQMSQIPMAQKLIAGTLEGSSYSCEEMAEITGMNKAQIKQLYLLRVSLYGDTSRWQLPAKNMLDFISRDIMQNEMFSDMIEPEMASQVKGAKLLADAVISGREYTAKEITALLSSVAGNDMLNEDTVNLALVYLSSSTNYDSSWKLNIQELFAHLSENMVNNPKYSALISDSIKAKLSEVSGAMEMGVNMLKGKEYSRMIFQTTFPIESAETTAFMNKIESASADAENEIYMIGNSAMNHEMAKSFDRELLMITLLTFFAIFIIVAITFKGIAAPLILVMLVQCGVSITVTLIGWQGFSIYFLALLIVECILMGATIDYGILLTNYYRESRQTMDIKQSLAAAYKGSIHTILTSGLIMTVVTGVISVAYNEPTIAQICRTICIGVLSAMLLIVFVLPGLLAAFDKFVVIKNKKKKQNN